MALEVYFMITGLKRDKKDFQKGSRHQILFTVNKSLKKVTQVK